MNVADQRGVSAALASSSLGTLPRELIDRLTDGSVLRDVAAGTTVSQGGDPPFWYLVVHGLIRAYVSAPNGRTMTIRYCRPGALMGTGTLFNRGSRAAHGVLTALVDSQLLGLRLDTARALADREIAVTRALLSETSARLADYINELEASSMASLRQRLARHLLDLAADGPRGPLLVANASQEDLAAAVGTVREIVVRILRDMRNEGLVKTGRAAVVLLDPERMEAETYVRQRERSV